MPADTSAAHTFIRANARVLELHVHAVCFEGGSADPVVAALAAHQHIDGGFGHGLEPDTRSPHSQPLDVEVAFERLVMAGADAPDMVGRACDYLASVADDQGAVPLLLPSIADFPVASHWVGQGTMPPALNPTAGLAGLATALGVEHPWVDSATEWAFTTLEAGDLPDDAHAYREVARVLEHAADRERAQRLEPAVAAALPESAMFQLEPRPGEYGLTPLHIAPTPTCRARAWFDDAVIEAHLDALADGQEDDGGWRIHWQPPGPAGVYEWRAIVTLDALLVLRAYGR